MKIIIVGGDATGIINSGKLRIKFNGVSNHYYDASELTKEVIEEIRKNPQEAKKYVKDINEVDISKIDKKTKNL